MCLVRLPFCADAYSQPGSVHLCGFSPVCVRMCLVRVQSTLVGTRTKKGYQEYGDNGEDDDDDDDDEENVHRLRSAPMQGGRASLWGLVPPTDMKAEEVDDATPKMLTRISKWQKGWS